MGESIHEKLLESLYDGVYYVGLDRRINLWNQASERITGFAKVEVLGSRCNDNILRHVDEEGNKLCTDGCPLSATMVDGKIREENVYLQHAEGHRVPVTIKVSPVRDESGNIIGCVEVFTDKSTSHQIIKENEILKKEIFRDVLTGVGNRRYGEMELQTCLFQWQSHGMPFGIIFLDIDNFKNINDNHGHTTGDAVLVMVSKTISNLLRRMDVLCRWGGEEFVVILKGITEDALCSASERIRVFIESSFFVKSEIKLMVTASLGATMVKPDDTPETIIQRADSLMYQSKVSGRNRVTFG